MGLGGSRKHVLDGGPDLLCEGAILEELACSGMLNDTLL